MSNFDVSARPRGRALTWGKVGAAVTTLAVALGLSMVGTAAQAAGPYATLATIDSITFENEVVTEGNWEKLSLTWSLPDNPTTPAGLQVPLPGDLEGGVDEFPMTEPGTDKVIGNCVVNAGMLDCEIFDSYIAEHPRGLHGAADFWVFVRTDVTTTTDTTYSFGEIDITVPVQPPWVCETDCGFSWDYGKGGYYDEVENKIHWWAWVEAPETGMAGGENVTVRDTPGANQTLVIQDSSDPSQTVPRLRGTTEHGVGSNGLDRPQNMKDMPKDKYTVNADGSVSFVAEKGYFYEVYFVTTVDDLGESQEYTNRVEFIVNGVKDGEGERVIEYSGGSATGIGTNVGVFTIEKNVTGTATGLDPEQTFTGTYTVTDPAGAIQEGTYSVKAGQKWSSPEFPKDSKVSLTEDKPTEPAGIVWGSADFSINDFTLVGGQVTAVTLTNTADVTTASFAAKKVVSGSADATKLVPASTEFTLNYSYPAGAGFAAGSGTIKVKADGATVTSGQVPVGAVVTVTEATPPAINNITWGTPKISPETFTVAADTVVTVTVENSVTTTTPPPPLANTGSGDGLLIGAGAIVLIAAGALSIAAARKRLNA